MKKNYLYIGILFVILVFGIIFILKIIDRINNKEIVDIDCYNLERKFINKDLKLIIIGEVFFFSFIN